MLSKVKAIRGDTPQRTCYKVGTITCGSCFFIALVIALATLLPAKVSADKCETDCEGNIVLIPIAIGVGILLVVILLVFLIFGILWSTTCSYEDDSDEEHAPKAA